MEEKLIEIARMMNDFSEKYGYEIDIETYNHRYIGEKRKRITYRLRAIKPEETVAEVIG